MFGYSVTEIIIIGVLTLILIGPDDFANAAQTIGGSLRRLRSWSAGEFVPGVPVSVVVLAALLAATLVVMLARLRVG